MDLDASDGERETRTEKQQLTPRTLRAAGLLTDVSSVSIVVVEISEAWAAGQLLFVCRCPPDSLLKEKTVSSSSS